MLRVFLFVVLMASHYCYAHEIRDSTNKKCMDVTSSSITNGTDIILYACTKNPNQNFIYEDFQLKYAADKSYCIDVNRDREGALVLWKCNGGKNQKFTFSNGYIFPHDYPEQCLSSKLVGSQIRVGATRWGSNPSLNRDGYHLSAQTCEKGESETFSVLRYCLYKDSNFRNILSCGNKDVASLSPDNTVSSVSVINSTVELYEYDNYKGKAFLANKNIAYVGGEFNDKASSIKVPEEDEFIITSDPQVWCGVKNCDVDDATSKRNITEQYQYFSKNYPLARAVIINGDMTSFGHKSEWNDVGALLKKLTIPYYFGLGNHDIYNNYNDCASNNCVIRSFVKFQEHVGQMRNLYSLDMTHSDGYQFPAIQSKFKGSLSYSVDFGDVLLIQLNDYEPGKNPISIKQYVSGWEGLGAKTYDIYRYQDAEYNWLHNQLYQARKKNQIIILNQHRKDADAGKLKELINKFNVKLKFSGHYHYNLGYDGGWYESGSSARGTWLKLALNKKEKTAKVYAYDRNGLVKESAIISLNTQEVNAKPPSPAVNVKVKNGGGYVSFVKISWNEEGRSDRKHEFVSGKLYLGNTLFYTVPPGSENIKVLSWNNTGLVWEKTREIFTVWHKNSDICIKTWGTTLNSQWGYTSCM